MLSRSHGATSTSGKEIREIGHVEFHVVSEEISYGCTQD